MRKKEKRTEEKRRKEIREQEQRRKDRQTDKHTHTSKKDLTSVFYERNNILDFIFNLFKYSNCQN